MRQTRVALIELAHSHDECMFAQINALHSANAEIYLVCHEEVKKRLTELYTFKEILVVQTNNSAIGDFVKMREVAKFLKRNQIEKAIFNTAQGGHIRNLRFLVSKRIECYGIVHTIKKFNESGTQKIIHKFIKSYAVLSDILKEGIQSDYRNKVTSFYPIEFPDYGTHPLKKESEIWITIPGGVESRRKDLTGIVSMLKQTSDEIKFVFAGKSDINKPELQTLFKEIKEHQLEERLIYFEEYITNKTFYRLIKSSNFLMPLIHPGTPSAAEYPFNQISGSFNLAFGFRIPLLMHSAYEQLEDLRNSSTFYTVEHFGNDLKFALENSTNKIAEIKANEKWNYNVQRNVYLDFINLIR